MLLCSTKPAILCSLMSASLTLSSSNELFSFMPWSSRTSRMSSRCLCSRAQSRCDSLVLIVMISQVLSNDFFATLEMMSLRWVSIYTAISIMCSGSEFIARLSNSPIDLLFAAFFSVCYSALTTPFSYICGLAFAFQLFTFSTLSCDVINLSLNPLLFLSCII